MEATESRLHGDDIESRWVRCSCRRHPEHVHSVQTAAWLRSMAVDMTLAVTAGANLDLPQLTGTTATQSTVPYPSIIATCFPTLHPSITLLSIAHLQYI